MQIIPVLDILHGQVVRGIAGRRHEYRPIVSRWTPSAEPLALALALHEQFTFRDFYLADLDAIAGQAPHFDIYSQLQTAGFRLWIDAGVRQASDAAAILESGMDCILGLETIAGPHVLRALAAGDHRSRILFSLDLKGGRPLVDSAIWETDNAWSIVSLAVQAGIRRVIVLDLARVGMGQGVGTEELCIRLKETYPRLTVITGGGVAGIHDLRRLEGCGIDAVLVASALHDGRLVSDELKSYCREEV
jgi:phosphoribosylformimino-5-aminoimidazole carboxamide ribotide isomerase